MAISGDLPITRPATKGEDGVVLAGDIRFEMEGHEAVVLSAGDGFFEPRNVHVLHFDNENTDRTATFVACYLPGPGQTEVITMSPPAA